MKTRHKAIIALQTVIIVIALMYAFFQETQADRARSEAVSNYEKAIVARKIADQNAQDLEKCRKR